MLRRSLLVSAVLLAGSFGFAGSAKAADTDVFFTGNVAGSCAIQQTAAGTLASTDGFILSSSVTGGSAATISVDCPGGTVSVGTPVAGLAAGSTIAPNMAATATTTTAATVALDGDTDLIVDAAATTAVTGTVNMSADGGSTKLPAGDYGYSVLVTVTP
ncbi:MAG: hypothetical protein HC903_18285 [Methylacidiphilales bacterium]|nr:hypothetical protein [Candidatus Methylacidiphilales bacterium]NJR15382.1 hypothetical protein [Calothrix sp. CSU_2_0]